ncbi:MAG: alpha-amylase family glycosyl hydrolase [Sandaracinaceae bacterium]|nr:alpha-amylase family glycosyl hydrolase [Sandaracinaceae bacterium]
MAGDAACALDGSTPEVDAGPPPPPCNEVTFRYVNAGASSVWVSGSFTPRPGAPLEWARNPAEGALVMENDGAGVWTVTATIEPVGRHEYKLIVDGTDWIADPNADELVPDCCGGQNSVLFVCTTGCGELDQFDWRDAVMYFAMVDRFADSDGSADPVSGVSDGDAARGPSGQYEGGDLRGATDRLDYLADLGVTAVWLSAPYENRDAAGAAIDPGSDPHTYSGYHGYWPSPANVSYADPRSPSPRPRVESRIGTEGGSQGLRRHRARHERRGRAADEGALRLRDEPRGHRQRPLRRAPGLVRAPERRPLPALRPREPLGRSLLGRALRLHRLPPGLRLRGRGGARLERERRHLVGARVRARRLPARRHQARAAQLARGPAQRAEPRIHRAGGRPLLPRR